ncbi:ABC transporter substrate-binding protein [Kocuria dechangensis]|uniref:ABC transporter substrate-binding protein n=1 Tax=Kocuria dechangensis TaxID=1176249 RepID=UPI00166D37E7|nr:sugar ABC transporter substrate-binding protein [Kocuria dechangensis]
MLYTTAEANAAALQAQVPAFEEKFGVQLEIDTQPYDALQQRVFSEFASSSEHYDIIAVDTPWAPALVGNLEPLSEYLTSEELNEQPQGAISDFIPKVFFDTAVYDAGDTLKQFPNPNEPADIEAITAENFDVYGLPIQSNVSVMAYRKDLFEDPEQKEAFRAEHGRELTVPETWDEYVEVAKFFTQPDKNLYGTTVMAGVGEWATTDFKTMLASYGGDGHLVNDKLEMAFDSPEGVEALETYRELIDSGAVPPGSTSASWEETATSFDNGLTAMTTNFHALELSDTVEGGEIAYAPVPQAEAAGPHFGTWMLGINANSNNKEWAYQAISWLTSSETQQAMTEDQLHPSRTSVYDAISSEGADPAEAAFYETLGESLEVGVGRPRVTNYTEISHEIAVAVNKAASGDAAPEAALSEAADRVTSLLEQAGYDVPGN